MAFHVALQWPPENDIADERSAWGKSGGLGGRRVGGCERVMKTFLWWFLTGAATTLGVLMVQGGFQDLISGNKSYASFMLTITGGGLLAGCIALILNRIK